ncbi:MAG TPA: TonB-dependent receptor [Steroidobacteraceae bacterium]|jgi:outer membrane receptor protein involved in Fe transport
MGNWLTRRRKRTVLVAAGQLIVGVAFGQQAPGPQKVSFDIARQPVSDALTSLAQQSGLTIMLTSAVDGSAVTPAVIGDYTPDEALKRLLDHTGLKAEHLDQRTVAIRTAQVNSKDPGKADKVAAPDVGARPSIQAVEDTSKQLDNATRQPPQPDSNRQHIEEVIVTAQKREERLIDVPMSVTALSGDKLNAGGIQDMRDLSYVVPGLAVSETGPGRQVIAIRGISSIRGSSSLIGMYLDEMPVSGAQDGFIATYTDLRAIDLDRVEVLKGPQGTLFGEGAAGGVIRFITKDPDLSRLGGDIATQVYDTYGGWSEELTGVANVPLASDVLGLRVAAQYENVAGWINQPSISRTDINDSEVKHVRVKLLYAPTPQLSIKGMAEIHRNAGGGSNIVNQGSPGDSNFLQAVDPHLPTNFTDDYDMYNLAATYDFGFAELLSSTSYAKLDSAQNFTQLIEGKPVPWLQIFEPYQRHGTITSQEFRFTSARKGPFNGTIGGDYKISDQNFGFGSHGLDLVAFGGARTLLGRNPNSEATNRSKSWAGFADASYQVTDHIEVGGGLRNFHDQAESFDALASPRTTLSGDFSKTTFRAYIKYAFSQDANVYFNVGSGFRSGGFNTPLSIALGGPPTYQPETTLFYELGTKMSLLDGRIRFNGAAFYGKYKEMLADHNITSPVDHVTPLQFTSNGQNAELKGVEWDVGWAVTDGLTLTLLGDVTHSKITQVDTTTPQAYFLGDPINQVPKYSVSAAADYKFHWLASVPGFVQLSFNRKGKSYYSDRANGLIIVTQTVAPEVNFLNATVGGEWSGWKWSVFGRNLLDEREIIDAASTGWTAQARPRTVGVGVNKSF